MERTVLVGVAGGVLLAATLVGVLYLEAGDAPEPSLAFELAWSTEQGPSATQSGTLQEGENATLPAAVQEPNVTEVEVRLVWQDDVGDRDRFRLNVTPPEGAMRTNTSRNGTVVLRFPFASVPNATQINASSRPAARELVAERFGTTAGVGNWTVQVTLVSAPGQRPVSEAPQLETEPDGENTYRLRFSYDRYVGTLSRASTGG